MTGFCGVGMMLGTTSPKGQLTIEISRLKLSITFFEIQDDEHGGYELTLSCIAIHLSSTTSPVL